MSFVASPAVIVPSRATLKVRSIKRASASRTVAVVEASEETSRRAALSLAAASAATLATRASAITIPSQESTAGVTTPKKSSMSGASMSGYTMEGTNKGGLSAKSKRELLAKTRSEALAKAQ